MPLYRYDSYNRRGGKAAGTIDAATLEAAKELLRGQGLMPISVVEVAGDKGQSFIAGLLEKPVDVKTVILFTKQLSVLLRSAVPLLQAIELLVDQFDGKFKRVLISIKDAIKTGEPFARELAKHPKIFSNVYVQLVKAGEASGKLEPILDRLVTYLEKSEETKKKVAKALRSPLMTLSFSVLVIIGLLTVLVPKLTAMFIAMKKELPLPTQILIAISNFLTGNYEILIVSVLIIGFSFTYWKSTPKGKYQWDNWMLRLPLTSYFSQTKVVVEFSKTLGMLMESGVNLSEALDIVCNIVENKVLTVKLNRARDNIIKEGKIAKYLNETGIFPKIALYLISTGEQSGKLGQMLLTVGDDYEVELSELSDSLTEKINPLMTVFMALVVGFIVLSVFMPMMSMGDMVK
ncbi:type II secretion system F family protein [Candidatus Dependentiae bacterium]|nr:type II secretion system F family protein [Candidatus Dependentiae bacterium]